MIIIIISRTVGDEMVLSIESSWHHDGEESDSYDGGESVFLLFSDLTKEYAGLVKKARMVMTIFFIPKRLICS